MARLQIIIELIDNVDRDPFLEEDQLVAVQEQLKKVFSEWELGFSSLKEQLKNEDGDVIAEVKAYNIQEGKLGYDYFEKMGR